MRCQQLKSTRCLGVAHELDFPSPLVTFSLYPIRIQNSGFVFLLIPVKLCQPKIAGDGIEDLV